jgi:hypothetical protein
MVVQRYELPAFLYGRVSRETYLRWLHRKALAHVRRDRLRLPDPITNTVYKQQIHAAVHASGGLDWYTGEPLAWEKISTYDNDASKADRSAYKAGFALLPTVDHVLRLDGAYDFVICGWRTNDAKNDLSLVEFLRLCRLVIAHHGGETAAVEKVANMDGDRVK